MISDVYLPFISDLEGVIGEPLEISELVRHYVVEISRDSLLPLLQVLQSPQLEDLVPKVDHVGFTERCLRGCTQKKNWVKLGREIVAVLEDV